MEAIAYIRVDASRRIPGYDIVIPRRVCVALSATGGRYAFTTLSCNCRARELLRAREPRDGRPAAAKHFVRRAHDATRYIWRTITFSASYFRIALSARGSFTRRSSEIINFY